MDAPQAPWEPVASPSDVPVGPHITAATWQCLERYDGRQLLRVVAHGGRNGLWSWHDEHPSQPLSRYLAAHVSDMQVAEVVADYCLDVEALLNPLNGWLCLVDLDEVSVPRRLIAAWRCPIGDVPDHYLSREMRTEQHDCGASREEPNQ